ncbi:receptor-like protein Cf-9 [Rhododendron vialii]|uniref:receptor-like protein Cf-9 n=1 Tax=Rhododendron vialii TaxID=182163 RepID=UPI00266052A8|nr:receptor-like protein Cf-9 [Rhododendron vialii]
MGALTWLFQFLLYFLQYQVSASFIGCPRRDQVSASSSSPLSSFASSAHPLCRPDQRSALLQFKHMFTLNNDASSECFDSAIPSYPKTLSWDEKATDCCNWDGITCDGLTGHVVGIDLSCSQLYGTIHPNSSLFLLSHLQRLNLANNYFNKSRISVAFGNFASLTHLNLSFSAFSGSIPSELSLLPKLILLDLSNDDYSRLRIEPLHFKILLKNLTQIQELILVGVNISSGLPESLTNLSSLTALDLSSTGLQGYLPESIFDLPNLQRLVLYGNNDLDINLPKSTWRSGSSLRELDLSYTNLSGKLPDSIGYLNSLNFLILDGCKLQGSIPKSLGNLTQLTLLQLSNNHFSIARNQLSGPIPFNLSGLQNLEVLHLYGNSLSGAIPPLLFTLPSLEDLVLSSNRLTGQIPEFQHDLPLRFIYLNDNKLRGSIPQSISTLVNLTKLSLSSNDLSGVLDLQILKNVEYLSVSNTNLMVVARSNVNNTLPNLRYFYMSTCNIEVFPYFLRALENLEVLDLSNNRIYGQIPKWVGLIGKASLRYLNLSHKRHKATSLGETRYS